MRTVSIIPGIENFAPERTDTNNGLVGSPNFLSKLFSKSFNESLISEISPAGIFPEAKYSRHAWVVIVKPGGTGKPIRTISARFAPFPPSKSD